MGKKSTGEYRTKEEETAFCSCYRGHVNTKKKVLQYVTLTSKPSNISFKKNQINEKSAEPSAMLRELHLYKSRNELDKGSGNSVVFNINGAGQQTLVQNN